jgi:hypothetical protein
MTAQPSLLDWTPGAAEKERDKALEKVGLNNLEWKEAALKIISKLRYELSEFTAEDLRLEIEARLEPPKHHNAYGSLTMAAIKARLIIPVGKYVPMLTKKSHGRKTALYRPGPGAEAKAT